MADSRLTRRSLKQGKRQLYIYLIAIVALLFISFNFGPTLIGTMGGFIDVLVGKSGDNAIIESDSLQAPVLDPLPLATPSAQITVSGRAYYQDGEVQLFVNGSRFASKEIDSQDFKFEDVELSNGDNSIRVRMVRDDRRSDFSEEQKIAFIKDAPKLEISNPSDKASFSKADQEINVTGITDTGNSVTVNGFIAIVDSAGNFSHVYKLNEGENKLTIVSQNNAGETTTVELTVSYSP